MELVGGILAILGAVFFLLAAVGLVRMPDVYNRIQAGTKATTLGLLLFLVGLCLVEESWGSKLAIIATFVLFTNPISSHAMGRALHRRGIPLAEGSVRDELAEREQSQTDSGARAQAAESVDGELLPPRVGAPT